MKEPTKEPEEPRTPTKNEQKASFFSPTKAGTFKRWGSILRGKSKDGSSSDKKD